MERKVPEAAVHPDQVNLFLSNSSEPRVATAFETFISDVSVFNQKRYLHFLLYTTCPHLPPSLPPSLPPPSLPQGTTPC